MRCAANAAHPIDELDQGHPQITIEGVRTMPTPMMTAALSAMAIAGTLTLHAQTPNPQTQQQPRTTQPQAQQPATQQPSPQSPTQQPQTDQQRAAAGTQSRGNAAER